MKQKMKRGHNRRTFMGRMVLPGLLTALVIAAVLCPVPALAAGANDQPDPGSMAVQEAAGPHGETATITLGKILTTPRADDFPAVSDFVYTIEAVKAWDNANSSTALSGNQIPAAQMPMPGSNEIRVGDFQDASAANHSAGAGPDTSYRKTRTRPVDISFAKAGYYVYKIRETGSVPGNIPGVDYDDNEYFVVFYVCNKVDEEGNTTEGVYVHSITSYTNTSGDDTYQPDLSDIQNVTDNGGQPAGENTGQVNADGSVSHNLGKVGASDPDSPNKLEAFRMWNGYTARDIVLKKNVTGNLGDRSKQFEFTVSLTGLEKERIYLTSAAAEGTQDASTVEIVSASTGTRVSGTAFRTDASGDAQFLVKMRDEDVLVLNGIPMTAQYSVSEAASDHVARYTIVSSNEKDGEEGPVIAAASGTNGRTADRAMSTGTETVNRNDGTVTIQFTNNRDLATITGLPGLDWIVYALAGALLLAAAGLLMRRRWRDRMEEMEDAGLL